MALMQTKRFCLPLNFENLRKPKRGAVNHEKCHS